MIGFNLTATSNVGFKRTRGAWSENQWPAKMALSGTALKASGIFTSDLIGGIEKQFDKLKDVLVNNVGKVVNRFSLKVTGAIGLSMQFDPSTPACIKIWKLLNSISLQNTIPFGDPVMIHLCKCITDFDDYVTVQQAFGELDEYPILTIDVQV